MQILTMIIIGIIAGWIASQVMQGRGLGIVGDMIVGIIGSLLGGYLFNLLGIATGSWFGVIVSSVIGGIILLFLVGLIRTSSSTTSSRPGAPEGGA